LAETSRRPLAPSAACDDGSSKVGAMAYRLKLDKSAKANLRKVALKQLDGAIQGLASSREERINLVHDVRVHLKRVRAALRLVRGAIGGRFQTENACFRDVAHALSPERDAQASLEMFDKLAELAKKQSADAPCSHALEAFRRQLVDEQLAVARQATDEVWTGLTETLRAAAERVDAWTSDVAGFETLADGLESSYRRGRRAMRCALDRTTPETLHEWRKQAKYHRYQVNLLEAAWPEAMKARAKSLKRLSDLLGDDHDLVVLRAKLEAGAAQSARADSAARLLKLIDARRSEVLAELKPLGRLIYAEKPKRLRERLAGYWRIARSGAVPSEPD
jgi:CHAD domain-containing protein